MSSRSISESLATSASLRCHITDATASRNWAGHGDCHAVSTLPLTKAIERSLIRPSSRPRSVQSKFAFLQQHPGRNGANTRDSTSTACEVPYRRSSSRHMQSILRSKDLEALPPAIRTHSEFPLRQHFAVETLRRQCTAVSIHLPANWTFSSSFEVDDLDCYSFRRDYNLCGIIHFIGL